MSAGPMSAGLAEQPTTRAAPEGLEALFRPRGIAVVGASADASKMGSAMVRSLRAFPGPVAAVNERLTDPAAGLHPSIRAAAEATGADLDLAVLCLPAPLCAAALERAAAAGARAVLVCSGGFGEVGAGGAGLEADLAAVTRRHGLRLLGPNTSGFLAPWHGLYATFVPGARTVPPGSIGVIAASGGVNHALAYLLAQAGHGISLAAGLGNAIDVTVAELVDHLADDADTTAIALHVESVPDGERLLDAVRRAVAIKPVVALVVGRADVGDFARSHTGALATAWRTTRAVLAHAGAVLVDDERELVDAVGQLSLTRLAPAPDPGVALVTAQAGPGLLVLDDLRHHGVRMPELGSATQAAIGALLPPLTYQANPVDTGRPGDSFPDVLATVSADPQIDVVAVYALSEPDAIDLGESLRGAGHAVTVGLGGPEGETGTVRERLRGGGVALHPSPSSLAVGVRALVSDARHQHRRRLGVDTPTLAPGAAGLLARQGTWTEHDAKLLLDALNVVTPRRRVCATDADALDALHTLRPPLAVKLLDAAVLHKTEVGGVHLGVRTPDQLTRALADLRAAGASRFLVEEMAEDGVDLIVGARRDPVFGPVVLVGLGGTVAEALADVALRAAPLSRQEARELPGELLGAALLHGWRGGPELDVDELARIVCLLGQVVAEHPHLEEIEVNPLRLTRHGLVALDAVITTRSADGHQHP